MYTVTKYPHGTFSWADNASTDPAAAIAFYQALFGWGKYETPIGNGMDYTIFTHQSENVAALSGMIPEGVPSFWFNYVTVDEVDPLADVVTANGGSIVWGPVDVMESGRMLHIEDPTGAHLSLWQPKTHIGAGIVNTVGAMCWNELCTPDAAAAQTFYGALLGWEFHGDGPYIHISNRGRSNGGLIEVDAVPPCWMPYFHVADIDEGMRRVEALGGAIVMGKTEAPGAGWWSVVKDPAGAHFYIMQLIQAEPWQE